MLLGCVMVVSASVPVCDVMSPRDCPVSQWHMQYDEINTGLRNQCRNASPALGG